MAENENIHPETPVPPGSKPDQPDPSKTDSDSVVDFDAVASVREGASGVIPVTELPDPQSSPSLVSWTDVIRQHRETQTAHESDEPVKVDSVSDKDLLKRIVAEELQRSQAPAAITEEERDTDKLANVPLVTGEESAKSESSVQFERNRSGFAAEPPSSSSVQFDIEKPPSDAGGAMPMPWMLDDIPEAFPVYEDVEGEVPLAELISYDYDDGRPVDLQLEDELHVQPGKGDSVARFIQQQDDDATHLAADPEGEQSSILELLMDEGQSGKIQASDVADVGANPSSDILSDASDRQSESGILSDVTSLSKKKPPSKPEVSEHKGPGSEGSGWLSKQTGPSRQTMPSFLLPESNVGESVDLYSEGPVSPGISDSGTLQISDDQIEKEARKQRNMQSSSIDLSSKTGSQLEIDITAGESAVGGAAPGLDEVTPGHAWRRAKQDDSAVFRGEQGNETPGLKSAPASRRGAEEAAETPMIDENDLVSVEDESEPRARPARPANKTAGSKKNRGILVGAAIGFIVGAGALFGAYFFDLLPSSNSASAPIAKTGAIPTGGTNPGSAAATPQLARQLLESGNPAQAIEVYGKCDRTAPAVLAGLGQAKWLVYLQKCAKENNSPSASAAEVALVRSDLKAAVAKAKGNTDAEIEAARAYLWQGMIDETFQNYDAAEKIYAEAKQVLTSAHSQAIFNAATTRLQVVRPGASGNVGMITPAHLLLAFTLLLVDEPEGTPKADEPADQECGFLFWEAMLLAAKNQFADAAQKLPQVKAVYERQLVQSGGKNLNPLSDPRGQILSECLDALQRHWLICDQLYKHSEAKMLVEQKKVAEALAAVLAKSKDAKGATDKLMLKLNALEKSNKEAEDARKLADDMLAAVGKSLKDAGVDDPKIEDGLKKLAAAKTDAETKLKAAAESLDKAGVKEPDLGKALAAVIALRDDADAVVKGLRERFEKAKYIDANASKDQVLKAVDDAITRGSADAVVKLAEEKKEVESKLTKLTAEFDKLSKQLADVRTPAQVLDAWLPALADKDRAANTSAALADAEAVLKNEASDNGAKAKALAVKALALRNQGKVADARSTFEELKKHPGFAKDQSWADEIVKAAGVLDDPAAFVGATPMAAPPSPQKLLEQVENGLKLFPPATFAKDHARLLAQRSLLKLESGDIEAAAVDADTAIAGGAGPDGQFALARVREKQRKFDEAVQAYRTVLEGLKEDSALSKPARLGLARALLERAAKPAAQAAPPAPAEPAPAKPTASNESAKQPFILVALLTATDDESDLEIHEAIRLADKLIGEKEYLGHIIKADALAKLGRFNAALEEYSTGIKSLKVLPKEYDAVLDRILALHPGLQKPDPNLHTDTSLALKHYGAGLELFRDGKFDKAEREFIQAIGYNSKDARYMYFLGLSRWLQGKTAPATADFKAGAVLEMIGKPTAKVVNSALESIQGATRSEIEKYRP